MKFKYFSILFVLSLLLSACNNGTDPKEHLGEIYSIALDSIMEQDEALSSDMKYIAIDMSNFDRVDESDKDVYCKIEVQTCAKNLYRV
ncbi:hypothetical protein UACE39S_03397 [Ureibacillus acetophenoni]